MTSDPIAWQDDLVAEIAGLHIRVPSGQVAGADPDDDWLLVDVRCEAPGATVATRGPFLTRYGFARWLDECEALHKSLDGTAGLESDDPDLVVRMVGTAGRLVMSVEITPDVLLQSHRMDFVLDQSYLPPLLRQLRAIVACYPSPNWSRAREA